MKIKLNFNIIIITVTVIIVIFRFWHLGTNPPHLTSDEASLGYNAYSVLKTGRDEHGQIFPIIFKSFGDYKPGLYVYLTVPFVALFGLNEWSVRLPSAIAGLVAIWLLYKIILMFNGQWSMKKEKQLIINHKSLAIIASLLLAISPWHIHFSRGAWEVNVALTLTLAGIYFFLKSLHATYYILLTAVFFALTLITYQGAKLSMLIVIFILFIVFSKETIKLIKCNAKTFVFSAVMALIISLPVLLSFVKGQTGRLAVFSVFSYPRPQEYLQNFLDQGNENIGDLSYYLFHSESLNFFRGVMGRYFNHFSGNFLFFDGDYSNPRHSSPNHGMLLLFDLILLPLGFIFLFRSENRKFKRFILLWLFLSPLPAVLSRDQVQAVRAFNMLVPLTVITSYGALYISSIYTRLCRFYKTPAFIGFLFIILNSLFIIPIIVFLDSYFVHQPIHNARYWEYGLKQVMETMIPIQGNYKKIYFQQSYAQPYIYYLFYRAKADADFSPSDYQGTFNTTFYLGPDVGLIDKIDNIEFIQWSWPYATGEKNVLLIGNDVAIPSDYNPNDYNLVSEIKYPDKFMTAFRILETK